MKKYYLLFFTAALLVFALAGCKQKAVDSSSEFTPAVIFDMGGKFDKSFNQSAYVGAEKFKSETGIVYREFEVTNPSQREQAIRKMAERKSDVIIGIGFAQADAIGKTSKENPDLKFAIVDAVVNNPNVQSIIFKEEEGSFLVGLLAALHSKSNVISFVGGMDIPLIRAFACGFEQGAKYAKPGIRVIQNMTGNDPTAWNNPSKGAELAKAQFEQGSDVVYAAAGGTGIGVYQSAKDNGKFAIGVDSNQNYLQPGTMLTSMVKRVDVAVYQAMKSAKDGTWKSGIKVLGLKDGGVDWALDEHNSALISAEAKEKVEKAKQDIIDGKITVVDYRANNNCNY
jgi:basic membrane protein A